MSKLKEKDKEINALKLALKEKESKETRNATIWYVILHSGSFRLCRVK